MRTTTYVTVNEDIIKETRMSTTPCIVLTEEAVVILGEPQALEALGHALLLKAKMGKNFVCTITDGINTPIKIISSDDLDLT